MEPVSNPATILLHDPEINTNMSIGELISLIDVEKEPKAAALAYFLKNVIGEGRYRNNVHITDYKWVE